MRPSKMVRKSGKFNKRRRDGGRSINPHLVLDKDGVAVSVDRRRPRTTQDNEENEDEEDDEEDEEEEEDDDEEEEEEGADGPELERKELKKKQAPEKAKGKQADEEKQSGDEDDLLVNPNHATKKLTISDLSAPRELTRREREQKEKQEAKDRYWKLHVQGKTDQAKADLSRLAKIRAEREAAAAKRKAEADEKAKVLEAAKAAQKSSKR